MFAIYATKIQEQMREQSTIVVNGRIWVKNAQQLRYANTLIGLDKLNFLELNCKFFLTHKLNHMFWVLKRTVSLRRLF